MAISPINPFFGKMFDILYQIFNFFTKKIKETNNRTAKIKFKH